MNEETTEQPKVVNLKVLKSHVKIMGTTRIHDSILQDLEVEKKEQLAIYHDGKSILRTMFADNHIEKDFISLRKDALKKLNVSEGDIVVVGSQAEMKKYLKALKETEKEQKE